MSHNTGEKYNEFSVATCSPLISCDHDLRATNNVSIQVNCALIPSFGNHKPRIQNNVDNDARTAVYNMAAKSEHETRDDVNTGYYARIHRVVRR